MIRWFYDLLYGTTPAQFHSPYSIDEAVALLSNKVNRTPGHGAVGTVTAQRVELTRERVFSRNSGRAVFTGTFETEHGRTVLKGQFGMTVTATLSMSFVMGLVLLFTVVATIKVVEQPANYAFLLGCIGLFLVATLVCHSAKLDIEFDHAWLAKIMGAALHSDSATPSPTSPAPIPPAA